MERAELIRFVRGLGCAVERGGFVFLDDPQWSTGERAAADDLYAAALREGTPATGWLCIRTGGSGGGLKFARHDEATLGAAVRGFCAHFGFTRVNAVGVLPPWHVSGFMARLRCVATGGSHVEAKWKDLEAGHFPEVDSQTPWVVSLVPTQLQRLTQSAAAIEWLRRFAVILLGGGPTWRELADKAGGLGLPVAMSYGMTETAAMVTAQLPSEFLGGDRSSGRPMPHAKVSIDENGHIHLQAASLFRGYFPESVNLREWITQDLGRIDAAGRLTVLGRADAVIISGGKKIQPAEVEAVLRASGEFEDVAVIGLPDEEWGEAVVACYPASSRTPDLRRAVTGLAPHQRPKRFIAVAAWPRNAQGKINRAALGDLAGGRVG